MSEQQFDPDTKLHLFNIRYGDITLGGDCHSGEPAIYRLGQETQEIPEDHDHYPRTEEEYEKYGTRLPDAIVTEVIKDIVIGCENFQALVAAGVKVEPCPDCPLLQK